ncbi:hypothetical protein [Ammoniphilus sp. YIM 78166]|uniref:hypothetical protein n=1 Tax=Ammoniphilus sp. YIM 78166 TaxID=1644106 RepID=UPI0010705E50|nr:hypothetical protein [Ammoniphilus sp. YIM 78166]
MRLLDIERKVLRIICNYDIVWNMPPTIEELCIKTGRDLKDLTEILSHLNKENYIEWSEYKPSDIIILERWERRE